MIVTAVSVELAARVYYFLRVRHDFINSDTLWSRNFWISGMQQLKRWWS
jgi:hypothetical protein